MSVGNNENRYAEVKLEHPHSQKDIRKFSFTSTTPSLTTIKAERNERLEAEHEEIISPLRKSSQKQQEGSQNIRQRIENSSWHLLNPKNRTPARGPYRKYDEREKRFAIATAKRFENDLPMTSKALGIPLKNIKRWMRLGPVRRKGIIAS
jgi:hypothetical protein